MDTIIHNEFNEIFETAGLIHVCYHPKRRSKEELMNQLSDRESIYNKFQPFFDLYFHVFKENFNSSDNDAFFFEEFESDWVQAIASTVVKNRHWLENIDTLSDEDIYQDIVSQLFYDEVIENMDDVVAQLEETTLAFHLCWKLILVLKNPKKYMSMYIKIIKNNLEAYKKARKAIAVDIAPLLADFKEPSSEYISRFKAVIENEYEIYPTFVNPFLTAMTTGCPIFCGLYLNEELEREKRKDKPRDVLAGMLKMLADQSKIEILFMLKKESMYNLQIANELGISAATTHHHMTNLLARGFVIAEKREGKLYYSLQKEQIKEIIADLEAVFL